VAIFENGFYDLNHRCFDRLFVTLLNHPIALNLQLIWSQKPIEASAMAV
jgi:hypothetical protein